MFNGSRFNAFGFNSNTAASLVLVAAEVTFSASAATSFEEAHYIWHADTNWTASASWPVAEALRTAYVDLSGSGLATLNGSVTINHSASTEWLSEALDTFVAVARYQGHQLLENSSTLIIDPGYQAGNVHFVDDISSFTGIPWKIQFGIGNWIHDVSTLDISEDLQINGLMYGDWTPDIWFWPDATVDTGLGYLELDGYFFPEVKMTWENIPYLTRRFIVGGFIGVNATFVADATRDIYNKDNHLEASANFEIDETITQLIAADWTVYTSSTFSGVRLYSVKSNLETYTFVDPVSVRQTHAGVFEVHNNSELDGSVIINYSVEVNLEHEINLEILDADITKYARSNIESNAEIHFEQLLIRPGIIDLTNQADITFEGIRVVQPESSLNISSNINIIEELTIALLRGNSDFEFNLDIDIDFNSVFAYRMTKAEWQGNINDNFIGIKIRPGIVYINGNLELPLINSTRIRPGEFDEIAVATKFISASALRLVDAPRRRTFYVTGTRRVFYVGGMPKDFGVAA